MDHGVSKRNLIKKPKIPVVRHSLLNTSLSSLSCSQHLSPFANSNANSHENAYVELKSKLDIFLKGLELRNFENTFKIELKYYADLLMNLSSLVTPYGKILSIIALNISKIFFEVDKIKENEYKSSNEKLLKKLETLSGENIEFYRKNQELKKELSLLRKSITFNESHATVETLMREIAVKSEYITKYTQQINEYKIREYDLLKRTEGRPELSQVKRSQSIKYIPRLLIVPEDPEPSEIQ